MDASHPPANRESEGGASPEERLADVRRRLDEHPEYREYRAWQRLKRTLDAVFVQNWRVLLTILNRPNQDAALAIELFQNMSKPTVREGYELAVTNALHNYVAGSATLIDHARRLMRDRTGAIADEFAARVVAANEHPELPFIKDMRNYVLHVSHPFLGHTVNIASVQGPITAEIELSKTDLLAWDGWVRASRSFIRSSDEKITLRLIVDAHGKIMVDLHVWLLQQLGEDNRVALDDVNRLMVEGNAILGGLSMEAAKRWTEAVTELRESPTPIKTEDWLEKVRGLGLDQEPL